MLPLPGDLTARFDKPRGKSEVIRAIVLAAVPLIAERGVRDVTFRDLALAAGVQHSLITRQFGTKSALVSHVAQHLGDQLFHSAASSGASFTDVWDQILSGQRTQLRALVRILLDTESKGQVSPAAAQHMEETVGWFRSKLDVGDLIQHIMNLSDREFAELRPRTVRLLLGSIVPETA